jgi:uncharacterized protein (DUF1697 family)
MSDFVALLRGINVGGHRVKMAQLRALFTDLGLEDVATFIASGNVAFSSRARNRDGLRRRIERHLAKELGYDVATFLRTPAELASITTFSRAEEGAAGWSHYVIFLDTPVSESVRSSFAGLASATDRFEFAEKEIHWHIQGKLSESPLFGARIERAAGGLPTTMRNMTTLRGIVAKTGALE